MDEGTKLLEANYLSRIEGLDQQIEQYEKYRQEYEALEATLTTLPTKTRHNIMVPFGPLAFFEGYMHHTNEITVLLGDNIFVERSASQAKDIVKRRVGIVEAKIKEGKEEIKNLQERINAATKLAANPTALEAGMMGMEDPSQQEDMFEIKEKVEEDDEKEENKRLETIQQRLEEQRRDEAMLLKWEQERLKKVKSDLENTKNEKILSKKTNEEEDENEDEEEPKQKDKKESKKKALGKKMAGKKKVIKKKSKEKKINVDSEQEFVKRWNEEENESKIRKNEIRQEADKTFDTFWDQLGQGSIKQEGASQGSSSRPTKTSPDLKTNSTSKKPSASIPIVKERHTQSTDTNSAFTGVIKERVGSLQDSSSSNASSTKPRQSQFLKERRNL